jgi:DUF917 family protein
MALATGSLYKRKSKEKAMKRTVKKQQLVDLVNGATLLGAGGGGSAIMGLRMAEEISEVSLVEANDVHDDSIVVVAAGMGSPVVSLKEGWKREHILAFERMRGVLGKKIDYIVPIETGGFNSILPMHLAYVNNIPVIDGDGAGRAIPELEQTTFHLAGIAIEPLVLADSRGNSVVVYPSNAYMAEEICRAVTTVFGMLGGLVCYPMKGKQLKKGIIPGAISLSEVVGRSIREAKENKEDPVDAALKAMSGFEIARGRIEKKAEEVKGGFDYGKIFVKDVVVDYKNENIIVWKNDKPVAMVPDLICWLTTDGEPLTNADVKEGLEVAIIGAKANEKWRVASGFELFKHVLKLIGYDGKYRAIESLVK